ncbi:DUF402 domain-containing protein [Spiroplasma endosymbiont of Othius punctulatus]|uniref:DUF402 domain-containing protein n=1 Tax=Spiroplasma endosymbiont of Othius punctulatus TaxID=3066289 RepID=UPI0030CD7F51
MKLNDKTLVHAYKHNGLLYRSWAKPIVFKETDEYIILNNNNILITEKNGKKWVTKDPALWILFKEKWYNIICMFKENGINFYCNIASPYIYEDGTIKYIDYDLDIRVYEDMSFRILDLKEFNAHRIKWEYGPEIVKIVWETIDELKEMIKKKEGFFNQKLIEDLYAECVQKK